MAQSNIERDIGTLLAKVANIETTLAKGDEYRATVHRRVDEAVASIAAVRVDLEEVKGEVGGLTETVDDMKDVTDEVTRWRLMGMGALAVTGIGAAALASIVTAYWGKIVKAIVG